MKESPGFSMVQWLFRVPTTDNTNAAYIFRERCSKPDFSISGNGFATKARRIVACLNACRGLPTDELEKSGLVSAVGTEIIELAKQRDQLLAALDEIARNKPRLMHDERQHEVLVFSRRDNPAEMARKAIEALKGGAS